MSDRCWRGRAIGVGGGRGEQQDQTVLYEGEEERWVLEGEEEQGGGVGGTINGVGGGREERLALDRRIHYHI